MPPHGCSISPFANIGYDWGHPSKKEITISADRGEYLIEMFADSLLYVGHQYAKLGAYTVVPNILRVPVSESMPPFVHAQHNYC